ncbi:MAG: DUF2892 domain-containing protein [Spirulina sp.]
MFHNVGIGDRFIRLISALVLLYLSLFVYTGSILAMALIVMAAVLTFSSIAGSCFLYNLFGINTRSQNQS